MLSGYTPAPTTPHPSAAVVAVGIALAAGGWALMFAAGRRHFWPRAALAAVAVGGFAVAATPTAIGHLLDRPGWPTDLGVGVGAGLVLYAAFWVGEQALVVLLPTQADDVADLYAVRGETDPRWIPVVLALAGTGEELFFRGFLQHGDGWAVALAAYGAVHLWERKPILILAAVVGGAWWGGLLALTGGLVAPIASHLVWAALIIWIHPARPTGAARRLRARLVPAGPQEGRGERPGAP